jgi:multidrug resistance efflux pump
LPLVWDPFLKLRDRQIDASFTQTGLHHLRIGNTAQYGVTH